MMLQIFHEEPRDGGLIVPGSSQADHRCVGGAAREAARHLSGHEDWRHEVMASEPVITLAELQRRLAAQGIVLSLQAINTTLRGLGDSYKKPCTRRTKNAPMWPPSAGDCRLPRPIHAARVSKLLRERRVCVQSILKCPSSRARFGSLECERICGSPKTRWEAVVGVSSARPRPCPHMTHGRRWLIPTVIDIDPL